MSNIIKQERIIPTEWQENPISKEEFCNTMERLSARLNPQGAPSFFGIIVSDEGANLEIMVPVTGSTSLLGRGLAHTIVNNEKVAELVLKALAASIMTQPKLHDELKTFLEFLKSHTT